VLTVAVSLALVGGALLLKRGVDKATLQWRGGVELSIFMKPDASATESGAVERELRAMPEVKRIKYVSQQAAHREFQQMFKNSPDFQESLTVDQMPPSYRVVPQQAEQVELIGERFKARAGVEEVVYAKDQIKALLKFTRILQLMLWAVALVLLLAASMLILNTIRMAIFARRREVAVMKLVGATNWFIRIPFMFEGLFQGVAGVGSPQLRPARGAQRRAVPPVRGLDHRRRRHGRLPDLRRRHGRSRRLRLRRHPLPRRVAAPPRRRPRARQPGAAPRPVSLLVWLKWTM